MTLPGKRSDELERVVATVAKARRVQAAWNARHPGGPPAEIMYRGRPGGRDIVVRAYPAEEPREYRDIMGGHHGF